MARKAVERNISYDSSRKLYYVCMNYGCDRTGKRIKQYSTHTTLSEARKALALMIALGLTMSLIMFVGARASLTLMLGESGLDALEGGMAYLRLIALVYVMCFIGSAYVGLYRGIGWVSVPVIGSSLQTYI